PAALMGQDISAFVGWALAMVSACEPGFGDGMTQPATGLGLAIGAGALAGRDKLTLILPESLQACGLWVEQLIAESTGKEGRGVVPVAGEPLGEPADYGQDRLFVRLRPAEGAHDLDLSGLVSAGMPVAEIEMPEPSALGAEFVRWEVATAI